MYLVLNIPQCGGIGNVFNVAGQSGEGGSAEVKKVSELKISLHASALDDIIPVCRVF